MARYGFRRRARRGYNRFKRSFSGFRTRYRAWRSRPRRRYFKKKMNPLVWVLIALAAGAAWYFRDKIQALFNK